MPPLLLALAMYLIGGFPWLVWGFCLPTVTLAHSTFAINTVNHLFGSRRFDTHRRVAQQPAHGVLRGRARAGTTTTTAISAPRATASTGGSSIRPGTSSALMQLVGLAWDVQPVPERIYAEARATKERHRDAGTVSVVEDIGPIGLELAEDTD